jgi:hypothetical protein
VARLASGTRADETDQRHYSPPHVVAVDLSLIRPCINNWREAGIEIIRFLFKK